MLASSSKQIYRFNLCIIKVDAYSDKLNISKQPNMYVYRFSWVYAFLICGIRMFYLSEWQFVKTCIHCNQSLNPKDLSIANILRRTWIPSLTATINQPNYLQTFVYRLSADPFVNCIRRIHGTYRACTMKNVSNVPGMRTIWRRAWPYPSKRFRANASEAWPAWTRCDRPNIIAEFRASFPACYQHDQEIATRVQMGSL